MVQKALMNNYAPIDIAFEQGNGATLIDTQGKSYLDALGGIAVCILGHSHPAITAKITEQANKLIHTSNLYQVPLQAELAKKLTELSGMHNVFFANSGAEANEAAIKLSRLHGHNQGFSHPIVITMKNAFHGRTMATLTATGSEKATEGFAPLVAGFEKVDLNNLAAIENVLNAHKEVVAIMLEPIQGEGGIHVAELEYLQGVRQFCNENNLLMILDEVQTGVGRTGEWFAFQHSNIKPDVLTLAKALGNGVPIGACLASGNAASLFQPGSHGSTFGGNPFAASVALAVIETIEKEGLLERAKELGQKLLNGFQERLENLSGVTDVRGKGLMLGIELNKPCAELVQNCLNSGLLINVTAGNVIRLLPPLIISDLEAEKIIDTVSNEIVSFLAKE